ncbi:MAG: ribonuclease HII [Candidatus Wallbacteria bacterium]
MKNNLSLFEMEECLPDPAEENMIFSLYDKKKRLQNQDNILHFFESKLRRYGFHNIAGTDEAGRGPLAGPVVAAMAILPADYHIEGLYDSKSISEKQRDKIFDVLTTDGSIKWAVGIIDNDTIDRVNILQATYLAVRAAYEKLPVKPDYILNDAMIIPGIKTGQRKIIKGDTKSASIAAASIIAKVTRDKIMNEFDQQYPGYGFSKHKGYGTAEHIAGIKQLGYCPIHRKSFKVDIS